MEFGRHLDRDAQIIRAQQKDEARQKLENVKEQYQQEIEHLRQQRAGLKQLGVNEYTDQQQDHEQRLQSFKDDVVQKDEDQEQPFMQELSDINAGLDIDLDALTKSIADLTAQPSQEEQAQAQQHIAPPPH